MLNVIIHVFSLLRSMITYSRIRHKLGVTNDELAIICPYGIGDTYFVCILSRMLAYKHSRTIVLVVKAQHLALVGMFRDTITRVVVCEFTEKELRRVGDTSMVLNGNLMVGHPSSIRKQFLFEMVGIEKINLLDCYKVYLGLPLDCQLVLPDPGKEANRMATNMAESLRLPKGNTVLLCPSCYSTDMIPADFWNELADSLWKKGFTVCTNVGGSEKNEIKGTVELNAELNLLIPLVEILGHVVSVRSGLCDLISSAHCHKVFVYPNQKWEHGTVLSGTSLVSMGLANDAREYVYTEAAKVHLIREIVFFFQSSSSQQDLLVR